MAILRIVKKLDFDLMLSPDEGTLTDQLINQVSRDMTLNNCLEVLQFADHNISDHLKINAIKFITLNLHSFFADGSMLSNWLLSLPVFLIRDIENFLKVKEPRKYLMTDMSYFEKEIDYEQFLKSELDIQLETELA